MELERLPVVSDPIMSLATDVLIAYADADAGASNGCGHDSGPIVLAALTYAVDPSADGLTQRVIARWLRELPGEIRAVGAFGGLGGFMAGIRAGSVVHPDLAPITDLLTAEMDRLVTDLGWRTSSVAWRDYDLFNGPAGLLLGGASSGRTAPFRPAARHLAQLCEDASLEALRAGTDIDPRSVFNVGRINTSMGHGVAGVASALRHAVEYLDGGDEYRPALTRACAWLVDQAYLAENDFITWPPIGRDGATPSRFADTRQAWCYGTPGVAWTLWDAGRVLADSSLQLLAEEAMRSFCRVFDVEVHIDQGDVGQALGMCHGAAGTLAVAEMFAQYANVGEAHELREHLAQYLVNRVEEISELALVDMTILTGATGILAEMMTSAGGGQRGWMTQFALR
jgi:hypothetical protein